MKATKILSLLLVLAMTLSTLLACNGGGSSNDGGGRQGDSWEGVDFGGQEVRFAVSVNQYDECTFPAADIYTKGPDQADSNEVTKEVLMRNAAAASTLNIKITYKEYDLVFGEVAPEVRDIVLNNSATSPDIFNNDMWGLSRAMIEGLLWNTKNPGTDANGNAYTNYFNYEKEGWYTEFIKGSTFDQNKYYLFAGDYFIDMIRLAWVVYVNNDKLDAHKGSVNWLDSIDTFYNRVSAGDWDFDMLKKMSDAMKSTGASGKTEKTDTLIGFSINNVTDWAIAPAAGASLFYLDENYQPQLIEDINTFQQIANAYIDMVGQKEDPRLGVFFEREPVDNLTTFASGNVLFASGRLGEMESSLLREAKFAKGVVPQPKWNHRKQDAYHTTVHDQAEIGCILKTAKAYSAASALMQYLNECKVEVDEKGKETRTGGSASVVYAYYDKGMKYKYNDDANSRKMMDIVRESTDDPFRAIVGLLCLQLYQSIGGSGTLVGNDVHLIMKNTELPHIFDSEKGSYKACLQAMIDEFASFD